MIRIGILLDSFQVKKWQREILKYIEDHEKLDLTVFIVNSNDPKFLSKGAFFYRISQVFDRKIFSVSNDVFGKVDIQDFKRNVPAFYIKGAEKRFSYRFPDEDIVKIKEQGLDLMIRLGFGILRGGILEAAKYGIWSLHHGDNRINRGGPPAFWEVVNEESVTGVTLQKLTEDLDGGIVIKRSFIKTNTTSFYRNKNEVFWAGYELLCLALNDLVEGKLQEEILEQPIKFYSRPLYKDPGNLPSMAILFKFWKRRIIEVIQEKRVIAQWFLLYNFKNNESLERSIFRYKKLYPPKGYDWADPFVIKNSNEFFLFFEELKIGSGHGHISLLKFDEKAKLKSEKPIKVLEESYHLSYPFILKVDGKFYMLPESADANELWLYSCETFPSKWKKHKKLFENKEIYDASVHFHKGYWYLFGTEKKSAGGSRDQYLHIYFSETLEAAEWIPHPKNPVSLDVRGARPAGRIFSKNGKLFRPSQIGAPKYGYGIQINEIQTLSPVEYEEKKVDEILPNWEGNLLATHTFNHEEGFTVIDAQGEIYRHI